MISLIAAIGKNYELGKDNKLIWNLKNDMKFFKNTTLNHTVVMGYNTYLSIGRPLPLRRNVILVHDKKLLNDSNLVVYDDINELIKKEFQDNDEEKFVIGGASLYKYFYNYADRMYLTLIESTCNEADSFFPKIDEKDWNKKIIENNKENDLNYSFVLYERKNDE